MSNDLKADIRQAQVRAGEQTVLDHLAKTGLVNPTPEAAIRLPVTHNRYGYVYDSNGKQVCCATMAARAAAIVTALNAHPAHDKLVDAVTEASRHAGFCTNNGDRRALEILRHECRAALAAAKETG